MRVPAATTAAAAVLALGACRSDGLSVIQYEAEEGPVTWDLVLAVEEPSVQAGQGVGYGLVMVSSDGDTVEVDGEVASDLEPWLYSDGEVLYPTVAGSHALSASALWEEQAYQASATLDVLPGEVAVLDLDLSDRSFTAGGSIGYTVAAFDAWGNEADASAATVEVDSPDVTVGDGEISGTVPGIYEAVASQGDVRDAETFTVVPAEPASVELALSDTELELYETTHASVVVRDAWGNETDAPWTLSATGTGTVVVSGSNVTFYDEGEYWVRVDVDGTELYDEVGPLLIDSTGPDLVIDTPERGDWVWGDAYAVSGTVSDEWTGVASLEVNGTAVTVASDGTFYSDQAADFGMNVVETSAVDGDGNETTDTRALLAGAFMPYGEGLPGGILARLHEGPGGLDVLEDMGEDLVAATDLDDLIPSPVYSDEQESCYDVLWWEVCVTWYSVTLYVTNPSIGGTSLDIDPTSAGTLDTTFVVTNVSLDWSASGTVVYIGYSGSGDITADSLAVRMSLLPYVSGGQIHVDVQSVDVSTTNFDFDMDGWLMDVLDFFGVPVDDWVQSYLESALEDAVRDEVPAMVEDALQDLEIGTTLEVDGVSYDLDAIPDDISVDDQGVTLSLETTFVADAWNLPRSGEGSLYFGYSEPAWTGSPGTVLALGEDFLNQVFLAFWGGGMLSIEQTGEDLGITADDLSFIFPGITSLSITADPLLPPVVVPGTGSSLLDLQVGDLELTLWDGDPWTGDVLLDAYVSAVVGLDLDATSDGMLEASLGDVDVWFDVVEPEANTAGAADTEALLEALVPMLLPMLTEGLGEVPLPDISGFALGGLSISLEGAEDGYVAVGGDLVAR